MHEIIYSWVCFKLIHQRLTWQIFSLLYCKSDKAEDRGLSIITCTHMDRSILGKVDVNKPSIYVS